MATIEPWLIADIISNISSVLYVAIGLGLVIFFHELGHFAVAKWCDVLVERFSIGFGPVIWSTKRGETEYALSAIPFGGYVKMLGQDDIDPSQLSSEEIAQDPRSYSAKSVPQRMAIISAGVVMNIITGMLFFASAFHLGVDALPAIIGGVKAGSPADVAGLETGDAIHELNDEPVKEFTEIRMGVALSSGDVKVKGEHRRSNEPFEYTISPDESGNLRVLGIAGPLGLRLIVPEDSSITPTTPGLPAHAAEPSFEPGDLIVGFEDQEISSYAELQDYVGRRREETLVYLVRRKGHGDPIEITVQPAQFRRLGLVMEIGAITQIIDNSPAAQAGLRIGDKITKVDGLKLGSQIDPLKLPEELAARHGREISIEIVRQQESGGPTTETVTAKPIDRPGWLQRPLTVDDPLSAPALGITYHILPQIIGVEPDSIAFKKGLKTGESIRKVEFLRRPDAENDGSDKPIEIKFEKDTHNWAVAFWRMQQFPEREMKLHVGTGAETRVVTISPDELDRDEEWYLPIRGTRMDLMQIELKAESFSEAIVMGTNRTKTNIVQLYLTLRSLFRGDVSVQELHGPVGIASVAYQAAEQGIARLLLFLGFLSINLAVLNFLPIPVLDGGHMVFLMWEAVTRKRPSERVLVAATYAGMIFVLSLMVLVLYLDIFVHWLGGD